VIKKLSKDYTIKLFITEIIIVLCSLAIVVPLLMVVFGSFKSAADASQFNISFPSTWLFDNYNEVLKESNTVRALSNSVIITTVVVGVNIFIGTPCAFVIARNNSKYTRFLESYFILGIIVPLSLIPSLFLMKYLHLLGSIQGIILLYIGIRVPWVMFLCVGFIKGIPRELDEAAVVDGCSNPLLLFYKIIFPLLKPIVVTCIIISAMGAWNEFQLPLYFLSSSKNTTMPMTVYWFFGQYSTKWNLVFANLVLIAVPVIILYLFCQKYIVSGMTSGAVKS
jgi:raffinose/stachyose/melibiose transport system permease protein